MLIMGLGELQQIAYKAHGPTGTKTYQPGRRGNQAARNSNLETAEAEPSTSDSDTG